MRPVPTCRFCARPLEHVFADLGMSPLANSYLGPDQLGAMEPFYPLRAYVCSGCLLVQLEEFETPEHIFSDYAYFSSYSTTWLEHARDYVEQVTERFGLDGSSHVVEIASNDGYLLQYFHKRHIPVLGIEPAANVAKLALQKGIPTLVEYFGVATAASLAPDSAADLMIGNNVLAHVPDLNDFVAGMKILLKPTGVITMEFPHLLSLIEQNHWDTIYHEHFSYFSFHTVRDVFQAHGLRIFDVERLSTHGGSLRIYAAHSENEGQPDAERPGELLAVERAAGSDDLATYAGYARRVAADKMAILNFLIERKQAGQRLVGYGAPAKANTLLNYCGVGPEFIDYTCDLNPGKQGQFLPGTHIPIRAPEAIRRDRPDVVLILPWNLKEEIMEQLSYVREWGGQFATLTPELRLY
ncbi:MAG TPA: class I SAM-dependent methyltransferase [Solirubrobacteraceae bacterium]|nr:class I SAM-dependent methyltransferase [Solirubrobacteraceae bacterium]